MVSIDMERSGTTDSPLESVADETGTRTTELFSLLSNETRLAILLALWEAFDPFPDGTWDPTGGNAVSFSALRDRVGVRQGAQFNYHLDKLVGTFVRKSADGYELTPAGNEIVRTVIGLAGLEDSPLESSEIDIPCPLCGAATAITYRDQRLFRVCTDCDGYVTTSDEYPAAVLLATLATPAIARNRSPDETFAATRTKIYHDYAMRIAGICSECSGRVEHRVHVCDDHAAEGEKPCFTCDRRYDPAVRFVCTVCAHWNETSFTEVAMRHPAVTAFCWEHDIELGYLSTDTTRWFEEYADHAQELRSTDPIRVRVTIRHDGAAVGLTLDEELNVLEVSAD